MWHLEMVSIVQDVKASVCGQLIDLAHLREVSSQLQYLLGNNGALKKQGFSMARVTISFSLTGRCRHLS